MLLGWGRGGGDGLDDVAGGDGEVGREKGECFGVEEASETER